jgi:multidrug resistance protein MdtO
LFDDCERIRVSLLRGESLEPSPVQYAREFSAGVPALPLLERTMALFPLAFQNPVTPAGTTVPSFDAVSETRIFVNDTLTNPEYLRFAFKGTLAAMICYIIYSAVDWPGIATAVFSCLITALSTIGASKQKQFMRLTGAFAGGTLGIACLVLLLPSIDSITGISLLLATGTALSAWFWTASPRINYFGIQMALGFYLTVLQGFSEGTSLEPPRDRLVGVLLSVVVMGIVFDTLWPTLASSHIRIGFAATLRKMGKFASLIAGKDRAATGPQIASLREAINTGFANTHSDADSIKFEYGPELKADRALRESILRWQSGARTLYLLELSLGRQLAIQSELHAVTPALDSAYRDFCETTRQALETLADRVEETKSAAMPDVQRALGHLETELSMWFEAHAGKDTADRVSGILATARQIAALVEAGNAEIPVATPTASSA